MSLHDTPHNEFFFSDCIIIHFKENCFLAITNIISLEKSIVKPYVIIFAVLTILRKLCFLQNYNLMFSQIS